MTNRSRYTNSSRYTTTRASNNSRSQPISSSGLTQQNRNQIASPLGQQLNRATHLNNDINLRDTSSQTRDNRATRAIADNVNLGRGFTFPPIFGKTSNKGNVESNYLPSEVVKDIQSLTMHLTARETSTGEDPATQYSSRISYQVRDWQQNNMTPPS